MYPRSLITGVTIALSALLAPCACTEDMAPREGLWVGDRLTFTISQGSLTEFSVLKVSCNGGDGCYALGDGVWRGQEVPITRGAFELVAETAQGGYVTFMGFFDSPVEASGTYSFHSDCCDIPEGSWHAEFREPLPTPDTGLPDAVTGDRTPSPDVPVPPDASEGQIRALEHLNALRAGLGLGAVAGSEALNEACQAHAQYYLYHCENYEETGLSPHSENPDWPEGFTGVNFANRVLHFGYGGTPGWEVMAFVGDPMAAIDSWMETLYHRIPFVDPGTADAGYGGLTSGCQWWATGVDVMDFGRGPDTSGEPVPYPAPGQTGVPASWDGMESPQPPLPAGSAYPSGPVITLSFPAGAFQIDSHRLLGPGPVEVAHQYLDPGSDPHGYLERTVALYALSPLQEGTTYTVELKGLWKGADATWQWQFTTGP